MSPLFMFPILMKPGFKKKRMNDFMTLDFTHIHAVIFKFVC